MASKDPAERAMIARLAAHTKWAQTPDRRSATAAARRAASDRFMDQVDQIDPDGQLPDKVRAKLAESARSRHFALLALKSAQVRAARRKLKQDEARLEAMQAEVDAELERAEDAA